MTQVTLSTKYQIVIPKEVRSDLHLKPRQKFTVLTKNGIVQLVPQRSVEELRGFLAGRMNIKDALKNLREKKDRF